MFNKVILIGNTGKKPEVKNFDSGYSVAKFSLATSKKVKKGGEYEMETQWHNIEVIGKTDSGLLKVMPYIIKGSKLLIEGEIKYSSYKKDGEVKYMTSIVASNLRLLDKKDSREEEDDDLPSASQGSLPSFLQDLQ